MGWARCTYRDCKVITNGHVHFFHYPVYDKLRCYKWLVNAQRMDFLDLTVGQLKNRMVCENHFDDDMFMNETKQKLKQQAIPRPFSSDRVTSEHYINTFPIFEEQIDTEPASPLLDKKDCVNIKYGNYLTNCEVMDLDAKPTENIKNQTTVKTPFAVLKKMKSQQTLVNKIIQKRTKKRVVPPIQFEEPLNFSGTLINKENQNTIAGKSLLKINEHVQDIDKPTPSTNTEIKPKKQKVQIISDTKIVPQKFYVDESNTTVNSQTSSLSMTENSKECVNNIFYVPIDNENEPNSNTENNISMSSVQSSQKRSLLRSPSDRAAINKKRLFNKRLRDILEKNFCSTVSEDGQITITGINESEKDKTMTEEKSLTASSGVQPQDYFLSYLEGRIKRMEALLMNRIDDNTKKIHDLMKALSEKQNAKKPKQWSISTQTNINEDEYKRSLYNEISQYLSADANSMLYEELFINETVKKVPPYTNTRSTKKKKM